MNKAILAGILLATASSAFADEKTWVNFHIGSKHGEDTWNQGEDTWTKNDDVEIPYNTENYGIGVSIPSSPNVDFKVGVFKNSYFNNSFYGGIDFHTATKYVSVGITVAAASGYENLPETKFGMLGLILPNITFTYENVRAELGYAPAYGENDSLATLTVGIGF